MLKSQASDTEGSQKSYAKLAFAGLKFAEYGSFDYGRNYGVVYDVEAWTDMLPVFGGDSYTWTDNFMTGRTNSVATYRNNDFFGQVEGTPTSRFSTRQPTKVKMPTKIRKVPVMVI